MKVPERTDQAEIVRALQQRVGADWCVWYGPLTGTWWALATRRHPWSGHFEERTPRALLERMNEVDAYYGRR